MLCLVFSGCSFDYSKAVSSDDLAEMIPETILSNISQFKVKNGRIVNHIEADKTESYGKRNQTVITNLHFSELNEFSEAVTEGWSDSAILHTDTEDTEMQGNIYFYSSTEKTGIYANTLYWNKGDDTLNSDVDETVTVVKEDGSRVNGKGFKTDFSLKEITFSGKVTGTYINDEEETTENKNN